MLTHIILGALLDSESPRSQGKALVNRLDGEQGLSGGRGWGKKTPTKAAGQSTLSKTGARFGSENCVPVS